jgi:hypothetical protein
MVGQKTYDQLILSFKTAKPTTTHRRKDLHLTNLQQQGQWTTTPGFQANNHTLVHQLLHVDTQDRHPDWDIQTPLTYTIQTGILTTQEDQSCHTHTNIPYLYTPTGKCARHTPNERLTSLQQNYENIKTNHTRKWNTLNQGGTFQTDLAALFTRYRATPGSTYTLPKAIYQAAAAIGINHHRTTNPISYNQLLPIYSSTHPADQLFGANPDPYQSIWTEGSLVDIPISTEQAHQALRWALASADYAETHNIPTCTLMLIPDTYMAP